MTIRMHSPGCRCCPCADCSNIADFFLTTQDPRIDTDVWDDLSENWAGRISGGSPANGLATDDSNAIVLRVATSAVHWLRVFPAGFANGDEMIAVAGWTDANNYLYTKAVKAASAWNVSIHKVTAGTHSTLDGPTSVSDATSISVVAAYDGVKFRGGIYRANFASVYFSEAVSGYGQRSGFGTGTIAGEIYITQANAGNCIACCAGKGKAPLQFEVTFADVADGTCADSASFNTRFTLNQGGFGISCGEQDFYGYNDSTGIGCDGEIASIRLVVSCVVQLDDSVVFEIKVYIGTPVAVEVLYTVTIACEDLTVISGLNVPFTSDADRLDGSASTCTVTAL